MSKDETKNLLLLAAEKLFVKKGYDAVSTRELAEEAGVNLAAIQYHFGSKAKLFVEALHRMMAGGACCRGREILEGTVESKEEAAKKITLFVYNFLNTILRPKGINPFRLVFREILSHTVSDKEMFEALVSSTVENFTRPTQNALNILLKVLAPNLSDQELSRTTASVAGQCSFYLTHQPFLERLSKENYKDEHTIRDITQHISSFTFRALGLDEKFIKKAILDAFEEIQ
ncbi:MAG: helix-turn-helix domain-containing protein [bacterium]|nr:helix-turn-helix domain-containing protein [bacterium]